MEKRSVMAIIVVVMFAVIFFVVTSYSQDDITHVEDSAFEGHMRRPVPFAHDEHNEAAEIEDCNTCHHVFEDGKLAEYESSEDSECSECHASEEESYPISLVKAYHIRCKECHLERKAGPVMCAECHPKN
jgi:hypothetical protein